jgi:hydroxysqualene dehydroxylase
MDAGGSRAGGLSVAIIGAGLAGLAAGCALADQGHRVSVFERRPWAGGKTYSFVERETGEAVDNGQHIFMACTTAYVAFLQKLGTLGLSKRQRRLRVAVIDGAGRRSDLWAAALPAPWHLAPSFAAYRHLTVLEKARIAAALAAMRCIGPEQRAALNWISFAEWLRRHGQTEREIDRFWDLIVVPTLNCPADQASAEQALFVFQEGILKSASSAAIGLPAAGLSALHVDPAVCYIERRGGYLRTGEGISGLEVSNRTVTAIVTESGARLAFDAYLSATPPRQLAQLLPDKVRSLRQLDLLECYRYAPIVSLHLWFDAPVAGFDFAAFTGSDIQWIFNQTRIRQEQREGREHLVLSLSAAERYMEQSKRELRERLLPQVQQALPGARTSRLLHYVAIKEPEATFVPAPGLVRPGPETPLHNLFLAGAYTETEWPATMESAVRSGEAAARVIGAAAARLRDLRQAEEVDEESRV